MKESYDGDGNPLSELEMQKSALKLKKEGKEKVRVEAQPEEPTEQEGLEREAAHIPFARRGSASNSSISDVPGTQEEELVPDDTMLDEFKKRTLERAQLQSEEPAAKKTREGESSEPSSPSRTLYPPLFAGRVSQEEDVFHWDEHEDLTPTAAGTPHVSPPWIEVPHAPVEVRLVGLPVHRVVQL